MRRLIPIVLLLSLGLEGCSCTTELGFRIDPTKTSLRINETIVPTFYLSSCGGLQRIDDHNTWTSKDPNIASVDKESGLITAKAVGQTFVYVQTEVYHDTGRIKVKITND